MRCAVVPLLALCLLLVGCAGDGPHDGASGKTTALTTSSSSPSAARAVSITVVGDSLAAGGSTNFSEGDYDRATWVTQVLDDHLVIAGGWALGGATTTLMRASVDPVDADVLVVMAGTNDVANDVPITESKANIEAIVRIVGGSRVIISAIPPFDQRPSEAAAYNSALRQLSESHGWLWVDPARTLRDRDHYIAGMTADGIHPVAAGQTDMARILKVAIEEAAERTPLAPRD